MPTQIRHARVLPSFAIALLKSPIGLPDGSFASATELVTWARDYDLSEKAAAELVHDFVARHRTSQKAADLWGAVPAVPLPEKPLSDLNISWEDKDMLVSLFKATPLNFQTATVRDIKAVIRTPLPKLIGFLARLESLTWEPQSDAVRHRLESLDSQLRVRLPKFSQTVTVISRVIQVSDELKVAANEIIQTGALQGFTSDDLRVKDLGIQGSLTDYLQSQTAMLMADERVAELIERAKRFRQNTAAQEVDEIIQALAYTRLSPRLPSETRNSWSFIFKERYVSVTGKGKTLQEIAEKQSLTRERIRQICEKFETVLNVGPIATPALDKALLIASRLCPIEVSIANEQAAPYLGSGLGVESAVNVATMLNRSPPVMCERLTTTIRGQAVDVTLLQREADSVWGRSIFRYISRDISLFGCTNVLRLAGLLALENGVAIDRETLTSTMEAAAGFRWLDQTTGWLTYGNTSNCAAAYRLRKILALAQESVGVDEFTAALASDDMMLYREEKSLGLAIPPVHVLREVCQGWSGVKLVQQGRLVADGEPEVDPLVRGERLAAEIIDRYNGVATKFEITNAMLEELKVTPIYVAALLGSSPIFVRLEKGLYCIRARRIGDTALADARNRSRARAGRVPSSAFAGLKLGNDDFLINITEASLANEQYNVPIRFRELLFGGIDVKNINDEHLGFAHVNQSGAMRGLRALFPQVKAGDLYLVSVLGKTSVKIQLHPVNTLTAEDIEAVEEVAEVMVAQDPFEGSNPKD